MPVMNHKGEIFDERRKQKVNVLDDRRKQDINIIHDNTQPNPDESARNNPNPDNQ